MKLVLKFIYFFDKKEIYSIDLMSTFVGNHSFVDSLMFARFVYFAYVIRNMAHDWTDFTQRVIKIVQAAVNILSVSYLLIPPHGHDVLEASIGKKFVPGPL